MASGPLVLGVDGGGTKTEAWLAEASAGPEPVVIGRGKSGSSNPVAVGFDQALANLCAAIDAAWLAAGRPIQTVDVAVLALSGAGHQAARDRIAAWADARGLAKDLRFEHDAEAVLAEAAPGGRGIALIVGTGSAAIGLSGDGRRKVVGGWGYHYGDEGSAYWIGRSALVAISRSDDGRGASTALTQAIVERLQVDNPRAILSALEKSGNVRGAMAALACLVETVARGGDPTAVLIVDHAALELAQMIATLSSELGLGQQFPLALAGGVICGSELLRQRLVDELKRRSIIPDPIRMVPHPVAGSLRLACRAYAQGR